MADLETEPLVRHDTTEYGTYIKPNPIEDSVLPDPAPAHRTLGWTSTYILVISRVIGSGIFAMPGTIFQSVGNPGLAIVLWVVGAIIAWSSLAIDLEYGCMLPRSGGIKVYLEYTYPWPRFLAATMVAVQVVILGFTATNCIVFAKYILFASNKESTDFNVKSLAIMLLTFITIVHGCLRRTGIWIQNVLGWVKISLVVFMIVTGLFVVLLEPNLSLPTQSFFEDAHWDVGIVASALLKIFYSYAGLDNANNVMNEIRDPVRTLKTVGPSALVTACVMYVLINAAYLTVVPLDEVKQSGELIAALFFQKIFGAGYGDIFLPIAIALSAAGNVMVVTFSLARLNQEVAKQGFLPYGRVLASNQPFGAPLGGLIVHFIPSALVILLSPSSKAYSFIAEVEGYAGQFFILAVAIGIIVLRRREPELFRPFKAWVPAVWFRIVLCLALIIAPFIPQEAEAGFSHVSYAVVAIGILLIGISYWTILTILLPLIQGYQLVERGEVSDDGTYVTRLVHIPKDTKIGGH